MAGGQLEPGSGLGWNWLAWLCVHLCPPAWLSLRVRGWHPPLIWSLPLVIQCRGAEEGWRGCGGDGERARTGPGGEVSESGNSTFPELPCFKEFKFMGE